MSNDNIKQLIAQGLQAAKAGSEVAKKATAEIQNDVSDARLKEALRTGNSRSQEWAQRIERSIAEVGNAENVGNRILEAHYSVSREIRQKAADPVTRDLGIIAAGQLALHYWIACFGTIGTYAASLGLNETERAMQMSVEEAKEADRQHTQLAENMLKVPVASR